MQQEIIEGNKLIAEFMGHGGGISDEWNNKAAPYNLEWFWLMNAVEKIKDIDNEANIEDAALLDMFKKEHEGTGDNIFETSIFCHLEEVYNRVIVFIKWYNTQSK